MNEELKVIISAEISKLKQNVEKAKNSVKGFQEQVKKAGADVDKNFKSMGTAISTGARAAATGLAATGAAILALGASTAEYRAEQARLVSAFKAVGGSARQANETFNDLYRFLGDTGTATEAAQQLANITQEEDKLAEYTTICQGVYAKWGTAIDSAGFAEGINHTIELGEVQGTLADALEFSGVSVDSFNEKLAACTDEAEREQLIRMYLNRLYKDSAATYEENNKAVLEQNEANARLQETLGYIGEAMQPVLTAFTNFANQALYAIMPYIEDLAANLLPLIKSVLDEVIIKLEDAFIWIEENRTVLAVMAGIITGIATAIGLYNAVAAVKAAMDAAQVTTLGALIAAYAAQAAAMIVAIAPYLAIVAAIAAVIAIIVLCIKHWDKIKETVKKVMANIEDWTVKAVNTVVTKFTELKNKAVEKVNNLKTSVSQGFSNMVSSIKNSAIVQAVTEKFNNIVNGIKEKMNSAKNTVKSIIDTIVGFFTGAKFKWPKISMPKFSISPSGWKVGDLLKGSIPKLSIKWNAMGGVFDKPTLFSYGNTLQGLGEKGAEAIVPLENNLGWLDKLATMLNERMGGNTPIVLNVDGKVFAQTAISTINSQTKQTGKLALNLV